MTFKKDLNKKVQTWSFDILVGVFIFMIIFIGFIYFLNTPKNKEIDVMKTEAQNINEKLQSTSEIDTSLIKDGKITQKTIEKYFNVSFKELKDKLSSKYSFCIYMQDENGNLIALTNDTLKDQNEGLLSMGLGPLRKSAKFKITSNNGNDVYMLCGNVTKDIVNS